MVNEKTNQINKKTILLIVAIILTLITGSIISYFYFQNLSRVSNNVNNREWDSFKSSNNNVENIEDLTDDNLDYKNPFLDIEKTDLEFDDGFSTIEDIKNNILNYVFGDAEFRNDNFYNLMFDSINIAVIDKYDVNPFLTRLDLAREIDVTDYEENFVEINYTYRETNSTNFKFRCTQILNVYLIANVCRESSNRIDLEKSNLHFVKKSAGQITHKFVKRVNEKDASYQYVIDPYPYYNVLLYNLFQEYAYVYVNDDETTIDNSANKIIVKTNVDDMEVVYDNPKVFQSNNEEAEKYFDMIINELLRQDAIIKVENNYIFNITEFVKKYPVLVPQGQFKEFGYYSDFKRGVVNLTYENSGRSVRIISEFYNSGSQGNVNVNCSEANGTNQIKINDKSYEAIVCRGDKIAGNVVKVIGVNGYDIYIQAVDYSMNPDEKISVDLMSREFRFMTIDEAPQYEMKVRE